MSVLCLSLDDFKPYCSYFCALRNHLIGFSDLRCSGNLVEHLQHDKIWYLSTHKAEKKKNQRENNFSNTNYVWIHTFRCMSHMYQNWVKNCLINLHKAPSSKLSTTLPYLLHGFQKLTWITGEKRTRLSFKKFEDRLH